MPRHDDRPQGPCCASCHFYWEEANVFPLLPDDIRETLVEQHEAIRRLGFPPKVVDEHGDNELILMKMACDQYKANKQFDMCEKLTAMCAAVAHDHVCLERLRCQACAE